MDLYLHGTIKTYKSRRFLLDESTRGYDHDWWTFPDGYFNFGGFWGESRDADPMFAVTSAAPITNGTDTHFYVGYTLAMSNCTDPDRSDSPEIIDNDGNMP